VSAHMRVIYVICC